MYVSGKIIPKRIRCAARLLESTSDLVIKVNYEGISNRADYTSAEFDLPEIILDVLRKFQLLMPSLLAVLCKDISALTNS